MKKSLFLILALFWGCLAINARPAYPGKLSVTLPDGKQVVLTHRGDEHFSFFTDEEGNAYRRSANQGGFEQISMDEVREIWQSRLTRANKARSIRAAKRVGKPAGNLIGTKKGLVILMQYADYSFVTKNVKAVFQDYFISRSLPRAYFLTASAASSPASAWAEAVSSPEGQLMRGAA